MLHQTRKGKSMNGNLTRLDVGVNRLIKYIGFILQIIVQIMVKFGN